MRPYGRADGDLVDRFVVPEQHGAAVEVADVDS